MLANFLFIFVVKVVQMFLQFSFYQKRLGAALNLAFIQGLSIRMLIDDVLLQK
jgi:hypothetical protein